MALGISRAVFSLVIFVISLSVIEIYKNKIKKKKEIKYVSKICIYECCKNISQHVFSFFV